MKTIDKQSLTKKFRSHILWLQCCGSLLWGTKKGKEDNK